MDRDILWFILGLLSSQVGIAVKYYFDQKAKRDERAWAAKQELVRGLRPRIIKAMESAGQEEGESAEDFFKRLGRSEEIIMEAWQSGTREGSRRFRWPWEPRGEE